MPLAIECCIVILVSKCYKVEVFPVFIPVFVVGTLDFFCFGTVCL